MSEQQKNCCEKFQACWRCFWEKGIWCVLAVLACIGLIVFIGTTIRLHFQNPDNKFWDAVNAVFAFFGVLLTAGAAFATVAAVVSYFSVNQKLQDAEKNLRQAQDSLQKYQEMKDSFDKAKQDSEQKLKEVEENLNELDEKHQQYEKTLQQAEKDLQGFKTVQKEKQKLEKNIEDLNEYRVIAQDLAQHDLTATDNSRSIAAAEKILKNPHADFEMRLKARAIVREQEIDQLFEEAREQDSETAWQEVIAARSDNLSVWKLLFQAALPAAAQTDTNNYAIALFDYGMIIAFYGDFFKENQNIEAAIQQWQQAGKQWEQVLAIKKDYHNAATNWGNVLDNEATALAAGCLSEARELWKQARKKYEQALAIKADNSLVIENWLLSLKREVRCLSSEERLILWQDAHDQATELQQLSHKHQESAAIQDFLAKIEKEIQNLNTKQTQ